MENSSPEKILERETAVADLDWHEVRYEEWPNGAFDRLIGHLSAGRVRLVEDDGMRRTLIVGDRVEVGLPDGLAVAYVGPHEVPDDIAAAIVRQHVQGASTLAYGECRFGQIDPSEEYPGLYEAAPRLMRYECITQADRISA